MNFMSLCQLGSQQVRAAISKNLYPQRQFVRYLFKTGLRANAAATVSINQTFSSRHQSLKIGFNDNLVSDFQYIWLRDNCSCEKCVYPKNKQKVLDTVGLDINIQPKSHLITEDGKLKITWPERDGSDHVSIYDSEWLHEFGKCFELDSYDTLYSNLPPMTFWNAEEIRRIKPEITYKEVMETEQGLKSWLEMMVKYGIVIIKDAPCEKGEVMRIMERVAYIKPTKWGSSFDVVCEPVQSDPNHVAFTGMYLEHHTDMNYLEKSPGLQALHCLKANPSNEGESIGGQSFFVDGFYVGKWLQNEHPSAFHVLTSTPVEFKIYSHGMEYRHLQYVLCASKTGTMQEVNYNTRTMAPLKGPAHAVQPFYEAYKLMGQKMREKESEFSFHLKPGEVVAFNNRRILHGRTSFDPKRMSRHLEGCYGDIDEIITRYRSLMKAENK